MAELTIWQNGRREVVSFDGQPMLKDVLRTAGYLIPHPCGGRGTCGKCAVTLDGKVSFNIPEGTQTGTTFTLREKGVPVVNNPRRRGDQRFTVVVETPTKLTKEQKDLLRQLDGTLEESPKRKKFFDTIRDIFD